jgi:deazaflavin-dependent oxidoreductase (nitroreductase family)
MTDAASTFEDTIRAEMRAHDGQVTTGPLAGHPLLVLTVEGAKSGIRRQTILTWSKDGDSFIVAGTAGGSPKVPSWVHNVRVHPEVTIEVGNRPSGATATVIDDGAEHDRLWNQHVAALPHFGAYPEQAGRVIPLVRLTPAG